MDAEFRALLTQAERGAPRPRCRPTDITALARRARTRQARNFTFAALLLAALALTFGSDPRASIERGAALASVVEFDLTRFDLQLQLDIARERAAAAQLWIALRNPGRREAFAQVIRNYPGTSSAQRAEMLLTIAAEKR